MANPSVSIPDDVLDDFDEVIKQKKLNEEIPMDTSRSEVITELIEDYIEGNGSTSTSPSPAAQTAN